ncbi:kinase-like domain-containing protein [Schizothecium vesticola]|uniref:dual-specificity kinase n=1 Tax=Schizothecium vesticola TaxID=314040 RepID=A0AA40BQN3_9PEZI|nr:kinase-like domain-containing protein [Schizothecium vesticola]
MSTPTTVAATSLPSHYNIHYSHPHYSSPHMLPCHPTNPSPTSKCPSVRTRTRTPTASPIAHHLLVIVESLGPKRARALALGDEHPALPPRIHDTRTAHHQQYCQHHPPPRTRHARRPPPSRAPPSSGGKRKRAPDWDDFYKNGLPQEIIVIDDTPEPSRRPASVSSQALTAGHTHEVDTSASENGHAAKRQKRHNDREPAPYDPVYHSIASSHARTSGQLASPSKSTVSSDRTNSAIHTTAATSLGSLSSSNGTYDYETQAGPKRRRTTRQQAANDAKRLEELRRDAFQAYEPPPFPPKKAAEVPVKVITDPPHNKNVRCDDEDGHYIVIPENDLTDRYQMVKLLGQGTFGKVVQARDRQRNKLVAIKIIRSVQKYRDASKIELRVLATLKVNDEQNRNRCIHLRDCFDYRGHICIVMDLLGQSVFDFLKSNNFVPFPNSQIQNFARQLLTSVAFLHDLNLIHTDLKPENILLCHNEYQTFTYNRKVPSSSQTVNRQATQRKVLLDTEIRLIDFGSATFQDEYHSSVVSTRHYRAPEIILGLGWSYPCDIWSIGCILVEFYTGDALFQTHDNLEHLAMMEAVVSARIDSTLVTQVNRSTRNGTNPASKYFKRAKLDYPATDTTRASRRFVKAMKRLEDIIPSTSPFLAHFLDLLKKIFVYDPAKRISAKDALQHSWFREAGHPDDGTEASRIRMERERDKKRQLELDRRGS